MPPKNKIQCDGAETTNKTVLIPPTAFEVGAAKLNIHASSGYLNDEGFIQLDEINTAKLKRTIYCDNEAMDYLRHCQGQFVALVASDLASCDTDASKRTDNSSPSGGATKKRKRKQNKEKEQSEEKEVIKTIKPEDVMDALKRLEFHEIVTKLESIEANKRDSESGPSSKSASLSKPANRKRQAKKKLMAAFKNTSSTADLLKEQERLFALSASKFKDRSKV
mmetsp:Transcript_25816/g.39562  ORF Transcript_25816/g.39562 Transcript_25816/m.39562 type:complete len:222 (-) Transcript_25816:38-703(-)